MALKFAASEASGVNGSGSASEVVDSNTTRATYSRVSLGSGNSAQQWTASLDAPITDAWIRFQVFSWPFDSDSNQYVALFRNSTGGNLLLVSLTSNGFSCTLQYWNGSSWVAIGSAFDLSTAYSGVMCEWVFHIVTGASGTATFYINGVVKASGSIGSATTNFQSVVLGTADNDLATYFSEIAIAEGGNSLIGSAVESEAPTGNGADSTDGTGAYTDIDEAINSDVDTLAFSTAGQRRSFTSPARSSTLSVVNGVGVSARAKCDVTGPQKMKFYLVIGGTRYYSSDITLTTGYAAYQYVWALNPATAAAWTTAAANAATLEWGIEAVT